MKFGELTPPSSGLKAPAFGDKASGFGAWNPAGGVPNPTGDAWSVESGTPCLKVAAANPSVRAPTAAAGGKSPDAEASTASVHRVRAEAPNDPKLSDRGVRRGTCMVGGKAAVEAGAVTHGAVRCSAWLAVAFMCAKRATKEAECASEKQ